jgi:hypothetical protein
MQNRKRVLTAKGVLTLIALAVAPATSAMAMQLQPTALVQQDSQQPQPKPDQSQPQQPDQSQAKQKAVVLTGTIIKNGSDFVLKDAQGTVYRLDAQDKAAPFENKAVKVTGKLEQVAENQVAMVHVDAIEPASA